MIRFRTALAIALLAPSVPMVGQNLVPNGSFEEFEVDCGFPNTYYEYHELAYWTRPECAAEPVVFHRCDGAVPSNEYGFQETHSGDATIYIWTLRMNSSGGFPDGNPQFYPSVNLTEPLAAGQQYCLRLWINLADSSNYRTGALHAFLWYGTPSVCNYNDTMWDTYAAVTFDISQVDTAEWTMLEGSFTASGSESNLTLGAFQFDEEIDSVLIAHDHDQIGDLAVYFIDDVEIWACEVGVNEMEADALVMYPNPATGDVTVKGWLGDRLVVMDALGQLVPTIAATPVSRNEVRLDVSALAPGTYMVRVSGAGTERVLPLLVIDGPGR